MLTDRLQAATWHVFTRVSRVVLAAVVVGLAGCHVAPPPPPAARQHATLGLCEDYPEESRSLANARRDLALTRDAGAKVLRIAFGWDAMEPERGRYDWTFWDDFVTMATGEFGLTLIPYVCYTPKWAAMDQGEDFWRSPPRDPGDFARFVDVLVRRYGDRIHSWELWNEPDNQAYWLGTPAQFAALIRAGSAAVRAADPQARIVLGGIAGEVDFLAKLLADERLGPTVDVVNIHSYFETWHPNAIERLPNYVESVAGIIRDTGGRHPIWMAETGYSSVGGRSEVSSVYRAHFEGEHTDQAQAAALVRTIVSTVATNLVELIAWYRINDLVPAQDVIGDDNNRHLGVARVDGTPKPALAAFAYLARLFSGPYEPVKASASAVTLSGAGVQPVVHVFRLGDNRRVAAAWLAMPNGPAPRIPAPDTRSATVRISFPMSRPRSVELHDEQGRTVSPSDATWQPRGNDIELEWTLRGRQVLIAEVRP